MCEVCRFFSLVLVSVIALVTVGCDASKKVEKVPQESGDRGTSVDNDAASVEPEPRAVDAAEGARDRTFKVGSDVSRVRLLEPARGRSIGLDSFRGSWTVLAWNSAHCVLAEPILSRAQMTRQSLQDVKVSWVEISVDEEFQIPSSSERKVHGLPDPIMLSDRSGKAQDRFGISTIPWFHVIDPQGHIRYSGGLDNTARRSRDETLPKVNFVADAIRQGSESGTIVVPSAPAEGCRRVKPSGTGHDEEPTTAMPSRAP